MNPVKQNETNLLYDVIIVGGGLAGLVSSITLSKAGFSVLLIEKKTYPFHKVCGEYVSNETLGYFRSLGFDPFLHGASRINRLRISDPSGKSIFINLDMGGFGISRYRLDHLLSEIATNSGVRIHQNCRVTNIQFLDNVFDVSSSSGSFQSRLAIGAYGKRDMLDKNLNRNFMKSHTGYMGVKYHIRTNYPVDEIGLDNFPGGYCGIAKIEEDKYNLCYLYRRRPGDNFKSVRELEERILFTNPLIRNLFNKSDFILESPEVINEIYFEKKSCVENHIFLSGDSAGLITPLCGNGMAMAVHGAKILSSILINRHSPGNELSFENRILIENEYSSKWEKTFSQRLFWGRSLQKLTGNTVLTSAFLKIMHALPPLEQWLVRKTHGKDAIA